MMKSFRQVFIQTGSVYVHTALLVMFLFPEWNEMTNNLLFPLNVI